MPPKRGRVSKFVDLDADVSGSASDDEDDALSENEDDRKFIDDAPVKDAQQRSSRRVKIRQSEKKMAKTELQHILEGAGLLKSTVRAKRSRSGGKRVYKDDDDNTWGSDDEGFIATSEEDNNADEDEEKVGVRVQKILRDYVRSEGVCLKTDTCESSSGCGNAKSSAAAAVGGASPSSAAAIVESKPASRYMSKDAFYLGAGGYSDDDNGGPQPPPPALDGASKKVVPPDSSSVSQSTPRVHPTPHVRGLAPMFKPGFLPKLSAPKKEARPLPVGVVINPKTGETYYRGWDGAITPRTL